MIKFSNDGVVYKSLTKNNNIFGSKELGGLSLASEDMLAASAESLKEL